MHLLRSDIMADGRPQWIFLRLLPSSPSISSILHPSTGHNQFILLICGSLDFTVCHVLRQSATLFKPSVLAV